MPLAAFTALACSAFGEAAPLPLLMVLGATSAAAAARALHSVRRIRHGVLELGARGRARWQPDASLIGDGGAGTAAGACEEGDAILHEQWPVTCVRFRATGTTVLFWPDTLCASGRRDLRRWARSASLASPLPQFWMG